MNTFNSMKYAIVLLPALAMSAPLAWADEQNCECPCADGATAQHSQAQQARDSAAIASARSRSTASEQATVNEHNRLHYIESKPTDGYFSKDLIGRDVMNRRDNKSVGSVNELVFDEQGQIKAVIVSTGGILGMGEKDLAIAWNQVQRRVDGGDMVLSVDLVDGSVKNAPKFARK